MNITNSTTIANEWKTYFSEETKEKQDQNITFWERASVITTLALSSIAASLIAIPTLCSSTTLSTSSIIALQVLAGLAGPILSCFQYFENQKTNIIHSKKKTEDLSKAYTQALEEHKLNKDTPPSLMLATHSYIIYWKTILSNLESEKTAEKISMKAPLKNYLESLISKLQEEKTVSETSLKKTHLKKSKKHHHSTYFSIPKQITDLFKETKVQKKERRQKEKTDQRSLQANLGNWISILERHPLDLKENGSSELKTDIKSLEELINVFKKIQEEKNTEGSSTKRLKSLIANLKYQHETWENLSQLFEESVYEYNTSIHTPLHKLNEKILTAKVSILFFQTLLLCPEEDLQNIYQSGMKKHGIDLEKSLYDFVKKKNLSAGDFLAAKEEYHGIANVPFLKLSETSVITRGDLKHASFLTEDLTQKLLTIITNSKTPATPIISQENQEAVATLESA